MEIIDELEPQKRGIYGGAMGYLGWNDNMDMAIAIRTAVIKDDVLHVQAGRVSLPTPSQNPNGKKRRTRPGQSFGRFSLPSRVSGLIPSLKLLIGFQRFFS